MHTLRRPWVGGMKRLVNTDVYSLSFPSDDGPNLL